MQDWLGANRSHFLPLQHAEDPCGSSLAANVAPREQKILRILSLFPLEPDLPISISISFGRMMD